MTNCYSQ